MAMPTALSQLLVKSLTAVPELLAKSPQLLAKLSLVMPLEADGTDGDEPVGDEAV